MSTGAKNPKPNDPPQGMGASIGAWFTLGLSLRYLFRNASRRKGRFILGALGVFVGVALMTAIQVGLDSLSLAYIDFATITAGKADALVFKKEGNFVEPKPFDYHDAAEKMKAIEGVAGVVPGIFSGAYISVEKTHRCPAKGLDVPSDWGIDSKSLVVTKGADGDRPGNSPDKSLTKGECFVSTHVGEKLALKPGDRIRVRGDPETPEESFRIRAVVRPREEDGDEAGFLVLDSMSASAYQSGGDESPHVTIIHKNTGFTALISVDAPAFKKLDLGVMLVEKGGENLEEGKELSRLIETGTCLVSVTMGERFGIEVGDTIEVAGFRPPFGIGEKRTLVVSALVEQRGMFPDIILKGYCALNFAEASAVAGHLGKASFLAVSFKDRHEIYDARDIHKSVLRARAIAEKIQQSLGLGYQVQMPKSMVLDLRESVTSMLRGIFSLFGAVALAISAILIYSLLSISVEERVRENAILQTLGAKKHFIVSLVVIEGLLLCAVGSLSGAFAGIGLTWAATAIGTAFAHSEGFPLDIPLFVRPTSVAIALGAGLIVSIVSSVLPARRSVKTTIIEALNAYRSLPSPWKIIKERGVNTRLVGTGFVITAFMGFFTLLIPRMLASGDPTLVAVILGIVLITLLMGMVLFSLGAQPLLERAVNAVLRPLIGRAASLAERNLRRYRRRNTATSLIFSLSVALVLFVASMATIFFQQAIMVAKFINGADLRVETYLKPKIDFEEELKQTEGVEKIAKVFVGSMTRSQDTPDWRIRVYISDMGGIRRAKVRLYGAGPELLDAMFATDILFHEGNEDAFRDLKGDGGESVQGQVILPRSIASHLSVGVGNLVKLQSRVGSHRAYRMLEVTAVTDKMPGFRDFYSGAGRARNSGVLVSRETFLSIMGSNEKDGITWRTIYFVKKKPGSGNVGKRLSDKFGWARMGTQISDTDENVDTAKKLYYSTQILFTAILLLSVTIALFGLLASMYTTVLERKREIVILKALGMRRMDLLRMFAGETTALLMTSGTLGATTGFILAYLLVSQQTVISELPTPFTVPVIPIIGMILIAVAMGIFGAWLPTRSLLKKSPAEIIRES